MCLILSKYKKNSTLFEVAKEDIICYKLLKASSNSLYTAYRGFPVEGRYLKAKDLPNIKCSGKGYYLEEGVIHSFASLGAAHLAILLSSFDFINIVVYECIIPKGTKYYKGRFGTLSSYGSLCIKFVEKCMIS